MARKGKSGPKAEKGSSNPFANLQVPLEVAGGTFLGTLRGGDDTVTLTGEFSRIHDRFEELRSQFAAGALSEIDFGRALAGLVCLDAEGNSWTIGASSAQWYRKIGSEGEWVATPVDYALELEERRISLLEKSGTIQIENR